MTISKVTTFIQSGGIENRTFVLELVDRFQHHYNNLFEKHVMIEYEVSSAFAAPFLAGQRREHFYRRAVDYFIAKTREYSVFDRATRFFLMGLIGLFDFLSLEEDEVNLSFDELALRLLLRQYYGENVLPWSV